MERTTIPRRTGQDTAGDQIGQSLSLNAAPAASDRSAAACKSATTRSTAGPDVRNRNGRRAFRRNSRPGRTIRTAHCARTIAMARYGSQK